MSDYEAHSEESEASYQTDDSDINFISGYVIEREEFVENLSDNQSSEGEICINDMAYAEEPLADEEWLNNYNKQEKERLELQETLARRLDGSMQLSEW